MKETTTPFDFELHDILTEEARMLRANAPSSARMVMMVILFGSGLLVANGSYRDAALWLALAGTMVGVTLLYSHVLWRDGIKETEVHDYLRGHVFVTACTGLVWGGFTIHVADPTSEIKTFIAGIFLTSITSGGSMEGTIYRPGYIALATTSLLPFGTYLVLYSQGAMQIFGLFIFLYFAFCYRTNERASNRTRKTIVSALGREAAETMYAKNVEIERLNAEKDRFMAAISHDMSQPLVAQHHLLTALKRQTNQPTNIDLIEKIEQTLSSQQHLLDDLIEYSQLEMANVDVKKQNIDIEDLFEQLTTEYSNRAYAKGISLSAQSNGHSITSDRHILLRILRNLLSNAVKFSDDKSSVTLCARIDGDALCLSVTDTGPGIAQQDLKEITKEYVRLPQAQDQPGLGLGMAIATQLADILGGKLDLHSRLGEGTRVAVCLPISESPQKMGAASPAQNQNAGEMPPFILVVGRAQDTTYGNWSELFSTWMWQFAHAEDWERADFLINSLGFSPDVIIWDPLDARSTPVEPMPNTPSKSHWITILRTTPTQTADDRADVIVAPFTTAHLRSKLTTLLSS